MVNRETAEASIHVLVVDDDDGLREVISMSMRNRGFSVHTARDGLEALDILCAENKADRSWILITDLEMPRLNGVGLIKAIIDRAFPLQTVIVMSGAAPGDHRLAESGALLFANCIRTGFLPKPFGIEELLKAIGVRQNGNLLL